MEITEYSNSSRSILSEILIETSPFFGKDSLINLFGVVGFYSVIDHAGDQALAKPGHQVTLLPA